MIDEKKGGNKHLPFFCAMFTLNYYTRLSTLWLLTRVDYEVRNQELQIRMTQRIPIIPNSFGRGILLT